MFTGMAISAVTTSSLDSTSFRIETKQILGGLADHFGMNRTKLSVRAGITKIKSKLTGLNLNRHGVRRGRREINRGPSLGSERAQSQNFDTDENNGGDDQAFGAAGKSFNLAGSDGFLENCQIKRARRICAARKDTPASIMVSDI